MMGRNARRNWLRWALSADLEDLENVLSISVRERALATLPSSIETWEWEIRVIKFLIRRQNELEIPL